MSKLILVDQKDNQVGLKDRDKIDFSKDITRFSALWITNSENQILLAQRKLTKKYNPGKWMPAAGGSIEENETYETNIYKEAYEELGIVNLPFKTGPKFFFKTPSKSFCQIFFLNLNRQITEFRPQEDEIEQIKWFNQQNLKKEIITYPEKFTEATHMVLNYLCDQ